MYREDGADGFLLLPDLNWDRKTMGSLHLLGLVERRDIWSVRDLRKSMVVWVAHMREKMVDATVGLYPEIERDELKLYVHCEYAVEMEGIAKDETNMSVQINQRTITFTSISFMSR